MQIALALYPKFTMLDIVGPFQVLVDVPGHNAAFVAAEKGLVPDHTGRSGLIATESFTDMTAPDVIVIPGGMNDDVDGPVVDWIRHVHPTTTWTTSVCTGSLFLAAAGLLDGLDATCHWQRATGHPTRHRIRPTAALQRRFALKGSCRRGGAGGGILRSVLGDGLRWHDEGGEFSPDCSCFQHRNPAAD
jgi:putative intracellular protease/amidase